MSHHWSSLQKGLVLSDNGTYLNQFTHFAQGMKWTLSAFCISETVYAIAVKQVANTSCHRTNHSMMLYDNPNFFSEQSGPFYHILVTFELEAISTSATLTIIIYT